MRPHCRYCLGQLHSHRGDKLFSAGEVAAATDEGEAAPEALGISATARHRAGNRRLSGPRDAAKPEDVAGVVRSAPRNDLVKQCNASAL